MRLIFFAFFEKIVVPILTSGGFAAVSSSAFAALYSAFGKYDVVHIHAEELVKLRVALYEQYADGNMSKEEFIRQRDAYRVQEDDKMEQIQRLRTEKNQIFQPVKKDTDNLQAVMNTVGEGIKYVLPILHPNKKRLALIMCPEEDSASVEWARQKDENWVNKDITSLEFVENIFRLMNWNRECRYKVLGRVANSDQGLCMLFDLEEAIMFTPKPQEYTDPLTGEMKKKQMKFFPDAYSLPYSRFKRRVSFPI